MCGACGVGPVVPPWEIEAHGGDLRAHRNRAAQASALTGGRLRVRPAGPCGYDVSTLTGRQWMVCDVDGLAVVLRDHGGPGVLAAAREAVGAITAEGEARARVPVAWALVETASR